ncbi:MAG: PRD domain-containing protein, partial [Anaerolineales bacterium]
MKKRSCEILQNLINQDTTPYVGHFAKFHGVSERTIRADINEINTLFKQMKIPPIKTVENGLIIINQEVDYQSVLQHIKKMGYYSYKLSPKERQNIIILRLVNTSSFVTMNELSDSLFVSRPTIISDIAEIKKKLKPYEMEIITQTKKGISIRFDETQVRVLMTLMLKEHCKNLRRPSVFQNMLIAEMSNRFSMDVIYKALQKIENLLNVNFSDEGFHNLLFYLFVTVNRLPMGNLSIDNDPAGNDEKEFIIAGRIFMNLASELDISIEDEEIVPLAEYIRKNNIHPLSNNVNDYPDIYVVMANFLYSVFKKLDINLFITHEYSLFEFLVFHIKALEERLQRNKKVENPYCDQIINEYGNVYHAVKENIYLIEEYLGCDIGQDEMSYITIHICAAIERHNSTIPRLSIVVACPGSMATGQLLAAQIDKHFKFDIRGVIAS